MKLDNRKMKCPNCGASGDSLSFWISGDMRKGNAKWEWECFECEHEWTVDGDGNIVGAKEAEL